jgi:hypothetical protein
VVWIAVVVRRHGGLFLPEGQRRRAGAGTPDQPQLHAV